MSTNFYKQIYSRDNPQTVPYGWIQWKGTDVCVDLHCKCGALCHYDGGFLYHWECPNCRVKYALGQNIRLIELAAEEIADIEKNHVGFRTSEPDGEPEDPAMPEPAIPPPSPECLKRETAALAGFLMPDLIQPWRTPEDVAAALVDVLRSRGWIAPGQVAEAVEPDPIRPPAPEKFTRERIASVFCVDARMLGDPAIPPPSPKDLALDPQVWLDWYEKLVFRPAADIAPRTAQEAFSIAIGWIRRAVYAETPNALAALAKLTPRYLQSVARVPTKPGFVKWVCALVPDDGRLDMGWNIARGDEISGDGETPEEAINAALGRVQGLHPEVEHAD